MSSHDEPFTLAQHERREGQGVHEPNFPRYIGYTAAVTLRGRHNMIGLDSTGGAFTVTLGSNLNQRGFFAFIKDEGGGAGANNITIATEGSETIDGSSTYVLNANYEAIGIYSNGTDYFILAGYAT